MDNLVKKQINYIKINKNKKIKNKKKLFLKIIIKLNSKLIIKIKK